MTSISIQEFEGLKKFLLSACSNFSCCCSFWVSIVNIWWVITMLNIHRWCTKMKIISKFSNTRQNHYYISTSSHRFEFFHSLLNCLFLRTRTSKTYNIQYTINSSASFKILWSLIQYNINPHSVSWYIINPHSVFHSVYHQPSFSGYYQPSFRILATLIQDTGNTNSGYWQHSFSIYYSKEYKKRMSIFYNRKPCRLDSLYFSVSENIIF